MLSVKSVAAYNVYLQLVYKITCCPYH